MIALLLAGTLVFCAGVLAIVFGIPIKEFSFGNTMILCGAVVASTGLILIGLGILAREVKQLSRRLGRVPRGVEEAQVAEIMVTEVPPPAPAMPDAPPRSGPRAPANGDFLFPRDEPAANPAPENEFEFPLPTPAARAPFPPRPERAEPAAAEKPRRDFLFSSRRRKEAASDAAEAEAAPRTEDDLFEPPWAQPERPAAPEGDFASEPRHPLRPQRRFTQPSRREEPPRREPQPEVTVVKSGVVDAMAYSLYSDGSIEAQLPEGTVRFESIDELRAHLDRR